MLIWSKPILTVKPMLIWSKPILLQIKLIFYTVKPLVKTLFNSQNHVNKMLIQSELIHTIKPMLIQCNLKSVSTSVC